MISYRPLFDTLEEKGLTRSDLRDTIDPVTIAKLGRDESVNLTTIEKICKRLKVPIEKVVKINYE